MSNKWKYFLCYALPWAGMLSIEKNGIAFATFILQLSVIGWLPAAIWARAEMKKHIEAQPAPAPQVDEKSDNTEEIINVSKSTASKKTAVAKKPKTTSTAKKTSSTTKPKTKAKAKPKTSS